MKLKFLEKFFQRGPDLNVQVEALEQQNQWLCGHCSKPIDYSKLVPLGMSRCPHCRDLFIAPAKIENWWLMKPLGAGGMGSVYMACHKDQPDAHAAVKVLQRDETNHKYMEALLAEAKVAHSFGKHPNLAQVHSFGYLEEIQSVYMIMAKVEGERLDNIVSRYGPIEPELGLYYMHDILHGLKHIFSHGYLYRDLKPENIIITPEYHAMMIDFGLCMTLKEAWNYVEDEIMGSPFYIPPERIQGAGEDVRGEIYSMGMVLYHAIKGEPYFDKDEVMQVVKSHVNSLRFHTKHRLKGIDEEVQTLIHYMIRINRDERTGDYDELIQNTEVVLKHLKDKPRGRKAPAPSKGLLKRREEMFG